MRKVQYTTWCDQCMDWVDDVLFEYVSIPERSCIEEVSIRCKACNHELLRGK